MDEFNCERKEAISVLNHGKNEMELDMPADGWELVGSSPGSPLPEARVDAAALEEAMASAGSSRRFLQGGYVGCTLIEDKNEGLPVSTVMADKKRDEEDGHSSEGNDAFVSLNSDIDATDISITDAECIHHGSSMVNIINYLSHNDEMQSNDTVSHDDKGFYTNLMLNDEHGQVNVDVCDCGKMPDEFIMNDIRLVQPVDGLCMAGDTYLEGVMRTHENNLSHTHNSIDLCEAAESPSTSISQEVLNPTPMSAPEMIDREIIVENSLSEDRSLMVLEEGSDSAGSSHGIRAEDSANMQEDCTIARCNGRPLKGFMCLSWVWSQLIRWQTQLGHANTIWSVALAAAVMGILVLGRGWQRLQAQNQSLRSQLWAKEKRITQLMFQLMQTKDSLFKARQVAVICVKPSTDFTR